MTEIHDLLQRVVDDPVVVDVAADVRRGRRALTRRRTRLAAGVTGGLVAVSAAGYAALPTRAPSHEASVQPMADPGAATVTTDFFAFATPPAGWHLTGADQSHVMISPDGTHPDFQGGFEGQLIISLEDKSFPMAFGSQIFHNGRTFYDNEQNPGVTILSVQADDGDWVQVQYPQQVGLDTPAMVDLLDSVVVKPGAVGARG